MNHVEIGGPIGEDGKETIRGLHFTVAFTRVVKAIQEQSEIAKGNNSYKRKKKDEQDATISTHDDVIVGRLALLSDDDAAGVQ